MSSLEFLFFCSVKHKTRSCKSDCYKISSNYCGKDHESSILKKESEATRLNEGFKKYMSMNEENFLVDIFFVTKLIALADTKNTIPYILLFFRELGRDFVESFVAIFDSLSMKKSATTDREKLRSKLTVPRSKIELLGHFPIGSH